MSNTPAPQDTEGRTGVARIEAFSDGVIAIIVTIMVLDLHAPAQAGLAALAHLWPTFAAYALSYAYVAIYWVNHHRLFAHARRVTNGLVWSNMALLFALSLVPFTTSYLGVQHFTAEAARVYIVSLLLPASAYPWLQRCIRLTGDQGPAARRYHLATTRKGAFGTAIYVLGLLVAGISPWAAIGCAGVVAVMWFLPSSRLDGVFLACDTPGEDAH